MKPSSNYAFLVYIHMLNYYGLPFRWRKDTLPVSYVKSFLTCFIVLTFKLCQIFERYLITCALSLTHLLSGILPKYESVAFWQFIRAKNTIWNRPPYEYKKRLQLKVGYECFTIFTRDPCPFISKFKKKTYFNPQLKCPCVFSYCVLFPPWGRRGFKSRIRPPYPQRVVKGD